MLREKKDEEAKLRAASEKALGEVRARRRTEEAELQGAQARWEEARRDEPLPPKQPQVLPAAGRLRFCFVCRWPGVRVPRPCPNIATHPPRPDALPRG